MSVADLEGILKILVIGGPRFVGLHYVDSAIRRGHEVTMFNRGNTNPELFPDARRILGDRTNEADLERLSDTDWDAVVDTVGYDVRVVQKTLDVMEGHVGHYTFVSSIGRYLNFRQPWTENGPGGHLLGDPDVPLERFFGGSAHYGPMKALIEAALPLKMPNWVSIRMTVGVAPTVGAGTSARAITYWAKRVRDYDRILIPGPNTRMLNFVDVRDVADFMVLNAERGTVGAFNLAGPSLTAADMMTLFAGMYGSNPELVWVDPAWLLEQGVEPNTEMPWWVPGEDWAYQFGIPGTTAVANGFVLRPIRDTVRDTVEWDEANPRAQTPAPTGAVQSGQSTGKRRGEMSRERELELLELWKSR